MAKKALAGILLALLAVFTVPVAANAYVPDDDAVTVEGPIVPGGEVTITVAETFVPGTTVTFLVTGQNGPTIAAFKASTTTASVQKTADENGTASATVTLPENATGTYRVEYTGEGLNGNTISGARELVVETAGGGAGDGDSGLPETGGQVPMLALWAGGGALLLGAALIATMTIVRRQRAAQEN